MVTDELDAKVYARLSVTTEGAFSQSRNSGQKPIWMRIFISVKMRRSR